MPLITLPYDRDAAVKYAKKWALSRNPAFFNYDQIGGDCTSFASQCIFAGAKVMNCRPVFGWYYIDANKKSPSWTDAEYLYNFLVANKGQGPFAIETDINGILTGDIIQLGNEKEFYHSLMVIEIDNLEDEKNIRIAAHTNDSLNRELSSYLYEKARFVHLIGVKKYI